jgi:DNA-binding NarL/FixJ family response regulator
MSPKTVETHVGSLFAKLGLLPAMEDHRRVLAVLTYLRSSPGPAPPPFGKN